MMDELIKEFERRLRLDGKSEKTIKSYTVATKEYLVWFVDSFGEVEYKRLYRENILEYKNYLKNVKRSKKSGNYVCINHISTILRLVSISYYNTTKTYSMEECLELFEFIDGAPFGKNNYKNG